VTGVILGDDDGCIEWYAVTETCIVLDLTVFVVAVRWIGIWFVLGVGFGLIGYQTKAGF